MGEIRFLGNNIGQEHQTMIFSVFFFISKVFDRVVLFCYHCYAILLFFEIILDNKTSIQTKYNRLFI